MKKIFVIFTALILASLCILLAACFSSWDGLGEEGSIVINLGNGGARAADPDPDNVYTVTITNSGETSISQKAYGGTASFSSVTPGSWNVLVRKVNSQGKLVGYGETDVEVKAGAKADATVTVTMDNEVMEVVNAWTDLKDVLEGATEKGTVLLTRNLRVNSFIEISSGHEIILLAKKNIAITKGNFANSLFRVIWNSTLILGEMNGENTITIIGNNVANNASLFYVGTESRINDTKKGGGKLIMNNGVFLTNNYTVNDDRGGGVTVDEGGTFNMTGGTILGNTADKGGGVRVLDGTFTKSGGIIYGSNEGSNSNRATSGSGHAVYFDKNTSNNKNNTLWSTSDGNIP